MIRATGAADRPGGTVSQGIASRTNATTARPADWVARPIGTAPGPAPPARTSGIRRTAARWTATTTRRTGTELGPNGTARRSGTGSRTTAQTGPIPPNATVTRRTGTEPRPTRTARWDGPVRRSGTASRTTARTGPTRPNATVTRRPAIAARPSAIATTHPVGTRSHRIEPAARPTAAIPHRPGIAAPAPEPGDRSATWARPEPTGAPDPAPADRRTGTGPRGTAGPGHGPTARLAGKRARSAPAGRRTGPGCRPTGPTLRPSSGPSRAGRRIRPSGPGRAGRRIRPSGPGRAGRRIRPSGSAAARRAGRHDRAGPGRRPIERRSGQEPVPLARASDPSVPGWIRTARTRDRTRSVAAPSCWWRPNAGRGSRRNPGTPRIHCRTRRAGWGRRPSGTEVVPAGWVRRLTGSAPATVEPRAGRCDRAPPRTGSATRTGTAARAPPPSGSATRPGAPADRTTWSGRLIGKGPPSGKGRRIEAGSRRIGSDRRRSDGTAVVRSGQGRRTRGSRPNASVRAVTAARRADRRGRTGRGDRKRWGRARHQSRAPLVRPQPGAAAPATQHRFPSSAPVPSSAQGQPRRHRIHGADVPRSPTSSGEGTCAADPRRRPKSATGSCESPGLGSNLQRSTAYRPEPLVRVQIGGRSTVAHRFSGCHPSGP